MTISTRFRIGAAALVAGTVLAGGLAAPAFAAGAAQPGSSPSGAGSATTSPPATDPAPPNRLADLKAKADADIKVRLTQLATL
ncbi:MAG: hypothetical protein JO265_08050, partial [Acidimicrobiia bacterium]|nr:hypothetical protein [Acidimicrobiia bacterium]